MALVYSFHGVSGFALRDSSAIGMWWDDAAPFSPYSCHSCVALLRGKMLGARLIINRYLSTLWRSASGAAYVTDTFDGLRWTTDIDKGPWTLNDWDVTLNGVWGTDDDHVFTWGQKTDRSFVMYQGSGATFTPMPSPGEVVRVHGTSPKNLLAVGAGGLLAHWDGSSWTPIPVDTRETLMGVFMASDDEYYVVGEQGGFFDGSAHGCRRRLTWRDSILADVAKFEGSVWVAGMRSGLLRLVGNTAELEVVKPQLKANSLDARGELLLACPDKVAGTANGKDFFSNGAGYLEKIEKPVPR
ncbi:MAG: hypothetical protein HOO96_17110 [Polyangiaceae bacterium]|nr:hypothetical protein [Polyangiaceae bacterium]